MPASVPHDGKIVRVRRCNWVAALCDLGDDFGHEGGAMVPLQRPPGSGLRFVIVSRLASTPLVRFKVDVSAADVIVGKLDS